MEKKDIIAKFARKEGDTGSPETQIALLSGRINHLTEHMRGHVKDFHSRRGLIALVSRRRKLLKYLASKNFKKYEELTSALSIRRG